MNILYTLIISPLYYLIEIIYQLFDKLTSNPGLNVIGVSIGITIICLPLYAVAENWQQIQRNKEKQMQPMVERIKKTFNGDEQYMILSTYYKQQKYHPLMALRSSFGLLIQIPFFMAAYKFLSKLPALQNTTFLFIKNMGQPDKALLLGNFSINVLPILMTLINIIAGAVYTHGFKIKDKISIYGMALIFLIILYNSPSGLVLYWTMNNIFSLIKNIFYKFKKPLKVFYLCVIISLTIIVFYFDIFFVTKFIYKIIASLILVLTFFIPFFLKLINILLSTSLKHGLENNKDRFFIFLFSCILITILSGFIIPGNLISSSPTEFFGIGGNSSSFFIFKASIIQSIGFYLFWPICLYFLFNKKIQTIFTTLSVFFSLTALINNFIFNLRYGDISSTLEFINVTDFKVTSLLSLFNIFIILVLFLVIFNFIFIKKAKIIKNILKILNLTLIFISITNLFTINKSFKEYISIANKSKINNLKPIFTLSKNAQNVILIFLDRSQGRFVPQMFNEDENFHKVFDGFTYYPQSLSFNPHTLEGSPPLFGGYEYTPVEIQKRKNETLKDKINEAILVQPRIFSEQLNYNVYVTDPSWANLNTFIDTSIFDDYPLINGYKTEGVYRDIWYKLNPESISFDKSVELISRNIFFFSIFKQSPILLREFIYQHGEYWNTDTSALDYNGIIDSYATLDLLKELTTIDNGSKGNFISLTNELTHSYFTFQAPDYIPAQTVTNKGTSIYKDDTSYHTTMAAFKRLSEYLIYLKENDVYDNTRIIIVSDHGSSSFETEFDKNEELDRSVTGGEHFGRGLYHCLLMIKDFNQHGDLSINNKFMTNADTTSLLLKDLINTPVNPFTNNIINLNTDSYKKDGVYISAGDKHQPSGNGKYLFSIRNQDWWKVNETIFDSHNWSQEIPQGIN